ncbi:hypothetical protein CLPU_2c01360 [Gottschalkia purinilytica]|uniref:Uncharacterized protein n=1 Tax=Gottschalkia purinilytica TaxID=1503 RepID=A0A0L0WDY2_GOTPU|nr:hypothetical protein [Gottschalkia purinilytica]KNF09684.1 hypothetical protein CLPU_2c01360 [Gottschalkia purinilytica]
MKKRHLYYSLIAIIFTIITVTVIMTFKVTIDYSKTEKVGDIPYFYLNKGKY